MCPPRCCSRRGKAHQWLLQPPCPPHLQAHATEAAACMREGRATDSAAAGGVDPALAGARRSSTHKREYTAVQHACTMQEAAPGGLLSAAQWMRTFAHRDLIGVHSCLPLLQLRLGQGPHARGVNRLDLRPLHKLGGAQRGDELSNVVLLQATKAAPGGWLGRLAASRLAATMPACLFVCFAGSVHHPPPTSPQRLQAASPVQPAARNTFPTSAHTCRRRRLLSEPSR